MKDFWSGFCCGAILFVAAGAVVGYVLTVLFAR